MKRNRDRQKPQETILLFADKLLDLANLTLAGLVIGNLVSTRFNVEFAFLGVFSSLILYGLAFIMAHKAA